MYHSGRWGTVCDDFFTDAAATVCVMQSVYCSQGGGFLFIYYLCSPGLVYPTLVFTLNVVALWLLMEMTIQISLWGLPLFT